MSFEVYKLERMLYRYEPSSTVAMSNKYFLRSTNSILIAFERSQLYEYTVGFYVLKLVDSKYNLLTIINKVLLITLLVLS